MIAPANLAAATASKARFGTLGTCPLKQSHVQLLPLRYGLVEPIMDSGAELQRPYTLQTRPLGVRLLRDGWLYIIDSLDNQLYEYRLDNGMVTELLFKGKAVGVDLRVMCEARPALVFSRKSTLYVNYAQVQWTAAKCHQVLDSAEDREHFMQKVDLGPVNCESGGADLLTVEQAKRWLAEAGTGSAQQAQADQAHAAQRVARHAAGSTAPPPAGTPQAPEHERRPYLWEQPPRFREAHMGELLGQVRSLYHADTLFLMVHDDLGVLQDLAAYQDTVVGWVTQWRNTPHHERDYLLACYIESLTVLTAAEADNLVKARNDPATNAMVEDLEAMPEATREPTRLTLLDYLNRYGEVSPARSKASPELEALRKQTLDESLRQLPSYGPMLRQYQENALAITDRRYYTRQHFSKAPPEFVERHLDTLIKLGRTRSEQVLDVLNGQSFGQRGINDLIDRPAMDKALAKMRADLERWNQLLNRITADRVTLVSAGRCHRALWYYDGQSSIQRGQALVSEYACLKDICRDDEELPKLFEFLEREPEQTRALFYTLPLKDQLDLTKKLTSLANAGVGLFNNLPHWLAELKKIEQPRLPALDDLPLPTRDLAESVRQTLAPALSLGINQVLANFDLSAGKIPDLNELFRQLPKALPALLLDAARTTGVTFTVASPAEHAALQDTLREVQEERARLKSLVRQREQIKNQKGHKTPQARELLQQIVRVRQALDQHEARLADALSPISELPDESTRLSGASPARAGVTLMFPPEQQMEVRGLLRNIRQGVSTVPNASLVKTEGMGFVVFAVQLVNLVGVIREMNKQTKDQRAWGKLGEAVASTGAVGFTAAQGLADTALRARSAQLATALQHHAVKGIHVQMGKMHIGLGIFTYVFGLSAAWISFNQHVEKWQQATRAGNPAAQGAAAFAALGAGGSMAAATYAGVHTLHASYTVLIAKGSAARATAWAAAGTRLSSIYFRVNLAGALFTAIELAGTWLYNYYNTNAHDQWLQRTPWGKDKDDRLPSNRSLDEYQDSLENLLQTPQITLGPVARDSWWKNLLLRAKPSDIHVVLMGLTLADLEPPMAGQPARRLGIWARRITHTLHSRGAGRTYTLDTAEDITQEVINSLRIVQLKPLALRLDNPPSAQEPGLSQSHTLELGICIQRLDEQGKWLSRNYFFRFDATDTGKLFPLPQGAIKQPLVMALVHTYLLELPDHAQ
ncbi:hypothetical protein SAMN04487858_1372 [Pseudomonas sp. ok602]|uniref:toxin VasX n=2 Tax=Pseudomonas sp. ok602 TaxID=1761898 RepID=UPI0008E86494|nr:toxin VasX [Pseudomonas sp. ok602]SFN46887.1 hypothetical protein SAMN04487858_1372 [Pseudomonas sp. ok602]